MLCALLLMCVQVHSALPWLLCYVLYCWCVCRFTVHCPGCYAMCSTADVCACLGCTALVVMLCALLLMCVQVHSALPWLLCYVLYCWCVCRFTVHCPGCYAMCSTADVCAGSQCTALVVMLCALLLMCVQVHSALPWLLCYVIYCWCVCRFTVHCPGCYAMCSTADVCAGSQCTALVVMLCALLLMCVQVHSALPWLLCYVIYCWCVCRFTVHCPGCYAMWSTADVCAGSQCTALVVMLCDLLLMCVQVHSALPWLLCYVLYCWCVCRFTVHCPGCYAMCSTADVCAGSQCTALVVMLCALLLMCVQVHSALPWLLCYVIYCWCVCMFRVHSPGCYAMWSTADVCACLGCTHLVVMRSTADM